MPVMPLPVDDGGPEREAPGSARVRRVVLALIALAVLGAGAGIGARLLRARRAEAAAATSGAAGVARGADPTSDSLARAPAGVRVKVAVVNATQTRGLARRATQALRDRGYDVVEVGTTGKLRDSSLVVDQSGHPDWARRLARAAGGARVEARPDSSHYLDLTLLLGRAWHPPAEPFYP